MSEALIIGLVVAFLLAIAFVIYIAMRMAGIADEEDGAKMPMQRKGRR